MMGQPEVIARRVERLEEGQVLRSLKFKVLKLSSSIMRRHFFQLCNSKVFVQDLDKPCHDLEETTFGEEVDTAACQRRKEEKKSLLERNLACINFVLIVLGILCITFMVHQGGRTS